MKILHLVPSYKPAYSYGGPIESVAKLCEGLAVAGHEIDVYTTTANGHKELNVETGCPVDVDGVNVIYFKRITKDPTHISPALWKHLWLNVKSYDIVNIQSWWSILVIVAACICHIRGVRLVVSPRGMLSPYIFTSGAVRMKKMIHSTLGRWALSKSWLHATAQVEFDEFRNVITDCKGFIAPNSVNMPEIPVTRRKNEIFTLIFMSRVHPKKGIEILLRAISKISVPVTLKIAGSGDMEYIEELKGLAAELCINHQIEWMGWIGRDDKFKILMDADLFVLVSFNENFANAVIESLHMGTPVLVSNEVALSSFVKEHDMGWVSSLSVNDVADKLTTAYAGHEKRHRINRDGRSVVAQTFSAKKLIGDYVANYTEIIEDNKKL